MTARAALTADGGTGALELRVDPAHRFALEVDGTRVRAVAQAGPLTTVLGELPLAPEAVLELRVVPPTAPLYSRERGPDVIVAGVRTPQGAVELARMDGRYLSTEVAGGFTGRMVGVSCVGGGIGVRSVEYLGGA